MTITSWTKAAVTAVAALVYLTLPAGTNLQALGEDSCIDCLTTQGCFRNCNCTCSLQGVTPYFLGCNSDGSANIACSDTSYNPPHYGTTHCDNSQCPSCVPDNGLCDIDFDCCQGTCQPATGRCNGEGTPILIDLDSNESNYHLTTPNDGVFFDIFATGVADKVSWPTPESNVAFLVLDRNHNGIIDDGSELFGNRTPLSAGGFAANGFEALKDLDGGDAGDGRIDAHDPIFAQLRVWLDRNHNGISEPDELIPLNTAGITAIFTDYRESRRVDRNGNQYRYVGEAMVRHGRRESLRRVFDVIFALAPRVS